MSDTQKLGDLSHEERVVRLERLGNRFLQTAPPVQQRQVEAFLQVLSRVGPKDREVLCEWELQRVSKRDIQDFVDLGQWWVASAERAGSRQSWSCVHVQHSS
jgi:hypothetical protein